MKKFAFLFIVLVSVQFLNAQIPSNCEISPILQNYYDYDVKHLALKRIFDQQSPAMDSIIIPQSYQDTVWEAMAAIFNLTDFPARDSIFDMYCIHQFGSLYVFYNIGVKLESTCTWSQNWHNLITTTGVPALDTLLSTYGFTVTEYLEAIDVVILTTNQSINAQPVCDSIETFSGVIYAHPDYNFIWDGNEIIYSKTGTNRFLDFEIRYGDCMAGCTGWKTFKFQVYEDCSVQYLGSIFHPAPDFSFPPPVNCNITVGLENINNNAGFRISPNPVDNILNIRTDQTVILNFSVINSLGKTVKSGQMLNESAISLDDLPNGLYFLHLYETQSQKNFYLKFIKN
jgi:hypothetical protein